MNDVTVIGLGAMGSAIARAFNAGGHDVTVWNRSADKMIPFADAGFNCAASPGEAVGAGQVIAFCIDDYAATRELIEGHALGKDVEGRIMVQFSTGTPNEARELERWALDHKAQYLDGTIMAYPREVGHDAIIFVSGSQETFDSIEALLSAMSSDVRYLGTAVGAAAGLNAALMSYYICTHLGLVHGALVCESEGVSPDLLTSLIVDSVPSDTEEMQHLGEVLKTGNFTNPGASIAVYSGVLDSILQQARDASINAEIVEFADGLYKRGMAAGLEQEEVVALIKLLRRQQ